MNNHRYVVAIDGYPTDVFDECADAHQFVERWKQEQPERDIQLHRCPLHAAQQSTPSLSPVLLHWSVAR